jgi:peptide/nickel transport system substrate-binding protein
MRSPLVFGITVLVLISACAPAAPANRGSGDPAPAAGRAVKTITIGLDEDVKNLWDSITLGGGSGARELANLANAHLVAVTSDGSPIPRLLTEMPSFERGTWRLLPDGRMETTYKLRSDALWHDGTQFTAQDVAFSLAVNRDPEVPNSNQDAVRLVDRWEVTDATTVVVTWRESYAFADRMEHRDLYPLPKHLLESAYTTGSKEAFLAHPFFSADFVGLGPFRVQRWESGSHVDFAAFDRYFLGRPRLDTIRVQFVPDPSTMLANLSARSLQVMLTLGGIPEFDSLMAIKRDWEASGYGTVLMDPISYRFAEPQKYAPHNPQPADLTDPRVRRAMYHAIDREALARLRFGEHATVADSWVHPSFSSYRLLQDAITKYPYDQRRATALFAEAGWRPGADGVLEKAGARFVITTRDYENETDPLVISAQWKEVGISAVHEVRGAANIRDRQDRATFTGVEVTQNPMGAAAVTRRLATYNAPTAENRWTGTNRGGYSNRAWDDLDLRMVSTLDERGRLEIERELLRMYTSELPVLPLYYRWDVVPIGNRLTGPVANTGTAHRGYILHTWNIHEWDLR